MWVTEAFYGQLEPLGELWKTEVADLARSLGVTEFLSNPRAGCEDYWYDDEVLGAGYDVIDPILHLMCEERRSPETILGRYGGDLGWLTAIASRVRAQPLRTTSRGCRLRRPEFQG